jgi:hypothetical protein
MPTQNLTRLGKAAEKKTKSVAMAKVLFGDVVATDIHQLIVLPADAVVTDAYLVVNTATQAAITADIGFAGGAELGNNLDPTTVGLKAGALVDNTDHLLTGTGKVVTIVFSAQPTAGDMDVVVEYTEPTLGNGDLTNYI